MYTEEDYKEEKMLFYPHAYTEEEELHRCKWCADYYCEDGEEIVDTCPECRMCDDYLKESITLKNKTNKTMTTCFLFGADAVSEWDTYTGTAKDFLALLNAEGIWFEVYKYEEGKSSPADLLDAFKGSEDYCVISEYFYQYLHDSMCE